MAGKKITGRTKQLLQCANMINKTCEICQNPEPKFLDQRTEQLQQEMNGRLNKWSSEQGTLEFIHCKPCWVRAVEQADKIAYENGVREDIAKMPYLTCHDYLKKGLEVVKGWYGSKQ